MSSPLYFVGVDVGSASVRGGLFDLHAGVFAKVSVKPISIHRQRSSAGETISQSSTEIWEAVCQVVREVVFGVDPKLVKGIGFDATCSLVVLGPGQTPLDVDGQDAKTGYLLDVIMWMDHRAKHEADFINEALKNHSALKFVGGQVSLEMEIPKILWLKRHTPEKYRQVTQFMDLCDFLSWKASGDLRRSMCSVVCKWLYQVDPKKPDNHYWDKTLLSQIDLHELSTNEFDLIGQKVVNPGSATANGVSERAAQELGLLRGTPVAVGLIDAHAGALALTFCSRSEKTESNPFTRLSLICGTSTCFMISSQKPEFVPGVWGPYYSAIVPDSWATEGGQSSAGQFLDNVVQTHPHYIKDIQNTENGKMSACYALLNSKVEAQSDESRKDPGELSEPMHIFPDYHGNRSPLSNPDVKGMMTGLTMDNESEASLLRVYVAALQALAYESRWIVEVMEENGVKVEEVACCGGLAYNPLFVKTLTDVLGKPVVLPEIQESVMLGSAILAATASGHFEGVPQAASAMAGRCRSVRPCTETKEFHESRYKVFRKMAAFQQELAALGT